MTYTADKTTQEALNSFQQFDVDTKLGLLWYGYLDLKDQLDPAVSGTSAPSAGTSFTSAAIDLVDNLIQLAPEQQLQALRDLVSGKDNQTNRSYSEMVPTAKLEFWLLLSKAMESGRVVRVPENYQLPSETDNFANQIKPLDFEQRVNFMKSAVGTMGANPQSQN